MLTSVMIPGVVTLIVDGYGDETLGPVPVAGMSIEVGLLNVVADAGAAVNARSAAIVAIPARPATPRLRKRACATRFSFRLGQSSDRSRAVPEVVAQARWNLGRR